MSIHGSAARLFRLQHLALASFTAEQRRGTEKLLSAVTRGTADREPSSDLMGMPRPCLGSRADAQTPADRQGRNWRRKVTQKLHFRIPDSQSIRRGLPAFRGLLRLSRRVAAALSPGRGFRLEVSPEDDCLLLPSDPTERVRRGTPKQKRQCVDSEKRSEREGKPARQTE
ncbi:hypothetical protein TGRUB_361030 [Toxoplasma gondii RUB]|uniref:Uncharacterized protein n=1 Tax=Toxoplasma gondii RUB TaxID=935652 RepID=A0A086M6X5_TOXGO|nr:hypothetical protein TGRUB_361030 [Toxoplasma gondii RUB]